jgi:hypothetical protein
MVSISRRFPKRAIPPLHEVEVQGHTLAPRWIVPERTATIPAVTVNEARLEAVRGSHRLVRISLRYASATLVAGQGKREIAKIAA